MSEADKFETEPLGPEGSGFAILSDLPGAKAARKAMEHIMASKTQWSKQRTAIDDANKFYAGDQWTTEDKAFLREQDRIPVVFNYTAKHIDMVVGAEIHNRQDTRFVPRNVDPQTLPHTSALGELETSAYEWVMDTCNGPDEISFAFSDLLRGGLSWVETYLDSQIDKEKRIIVRRIDPLEMMWDSRAKMQNLEDLRWVARVKMLTLKEAIAQFPEYELELRTMVRTGDSLSLDEQPEKIEEATPIMYEEGRRTTAPGLETGKKGMIPIIQYQWYEIETVHVVKDPHDGKEREFGEEPYKKLKSRAKSLNMPLDEGETTKRVYKQIFIAGNQLPLTDAEELPIQAGGFTFKCMTGKYDPTEKVWRGLLFQMMDPARYANKYLSQTIHIINSNPKGGLIAEADAFKDPIRVEQDWAKPNSITLVNKGALAEKRLEVKPMSAMPEAAFRLWQSCVDAITGVAGINVEMLGSSVGDQPAMTMRQRQVQGMQINAIYFNALTRMRRNLARLVLEYIREFMADGRLVRIGGPFNAKALPLLREDIAAEYDVVIDEAVRSPNAKAEVWAGLQPILPVIVRSGMLVPEIVDLVPGMPASLAAKIKERMGDQAAQPQPGKRGGAQGGKQADPQEIAAKVAKMQEEMNLLKAKQAEVLARARALDANTQIKAMVAKHEVGHKQAKAGSDSILAQAKLMGEANKLQAAQEKTAEKAQAKSLRESIFRTPRNPPSQKE